MSDQRGSPRQRTFKGGTISFATGVIECIVRNLSDTGACLEVGSPVGIPDDFRLIIKPENLARACHVEWRTATRLGVSFV